MSDQSECSQNEINPEADRQPEKLNLLQRGARSLRRTFIARVRPGVKMVYVVVNPASGQDRPWLKSLNSIFVEAGMDYEVLVTHQKGDATRHAAQAVEDGASMVAVYGGDGTVIETALGLSGSQVPMAILPGGTANMMSKAFNISQNFNEACALMVGDQVAMQQVNMGMINGQAFFQLAGIGMEAKMVEGADREAKDRLGMLAYGLSGLQALGDAKISHYQLELDGKKMDVDGVTCIIALVENMGMSSLSRALEVDSHPGKLDVVVLQRADLASFIALLPALVSGTPPNHESIQHWHACEVKVTADPPQGVQADGELLGNTPVTARIIPRAVNIIVPRPGANANAHT
jgi:YegS/Rv2252/BmrU family lipid kinase